MITDFFLALLLSLIQGLTEFLPVSSSAHLLLPSLIFGTKDFGIVFDISVHAGTLAAVIYYFKKEIHGLVRAWKPWTNNRDQQNYLLGLNILVATLPIIIVGLVFSDFTESRFANTNSIAWTNLIFAVLLYLVFRASAQTKSLTELTLTAALMIGCFQALAIFPGVSRSGVTISTALVSGWERGDAAKFSILLGMPAISLAATVEFISSFNEFSSLSFFPLIVGLITTFLSSLLAIDFLLRYFSANGLKLFVVYRVVFSLVILLNL